MNRWIFLIFFLLLLLYYFPIHIKNLSLPIPNGKFTIDDFLLSFKNLTLRIKTIDLVLYETKEKPKKKLKIYLPSQEILNSLKLISEVFKVLPLEIYIGNFYFSGGNFSLNVRNLSFSHKILRADYIEGISNSTLQRIFFIEIPKIQFFKNFTYLWATPFSLLDFHGIIEEGVFRNNTFTLKLRAKKDFLQSFASLKVKEKVILLSILLDTYKKKNNLAKQSNSPLFKIFAVFDKEKIRIKGISKRSPVLGSLQLTLFYKKNNFLKGKAQFLIKTPLLGWSKVIGNLKGHLLDKINGELELLLNSFPIFHLVGEYDFKKSWAEAFGWGELNPEIFNKYLIPYGLRIMLPENNSTENPINLLLYWSWNLKEPLFKNLLVSLKGDFRLLSVYLYKPLEIKTSVAIVQKGKLIGFTQFYDYNLKEQLGKISLWGNLLNQTFYSSYDFSEIPLSYFYDRVFSTYIKLQSKGKISFKKGFGNITSNLSYGGYISIIKFPSTEKSREENKSTEKGRNNSLPINMELKFHSQTPLYVKFPYGYIIIINDGIVKFSRGKLTKIFHLKIPYGVIKALGRTFYVSDGKVEIQNEKTYIEIPLTYYSSEKTVFLKIYGSLPVENLNFEIYSVPPEDKEKLIMELISGSGGSGGGNILSLLSQNIPLADLLMKTATVGLLEAFNKFSQNIISGVKISLSPQINPQTGIAFALTVEKDFSGIASIGLHYLPSTDPKASYMWAQSRFWMSTYLRFQRYADESISVSLRFYKDYGNPYR
jgi:hypothetical protein